MCSLESSLLNLPTTGTREPPQALTPPCLSDSEPRSPCLFPLPTQPPQQHCEAVEILTQLLLYHGSAGLGAPCCCMPPSLSPPAFLYNILPYSHVTSQPPQLASEHLLPEKAQSQNQIQFSKPLTWTKLSLAPAADWLSQQETVVIIAIAARLLLK